jgi:hypothetical protein
MPRVLFQFPRFAAVSSRPRVLRRELADLSNHLLRDIGIDVGRRMRASGDLIYRPPF